MTGEHELNADTLRALGRETTEAIVEIFTQVRERSAAPFLARRAPLDVALPEHGSDPLAVIKWIRSALVPQASLFHPRFFGYIPSGNVEIGAFAEALAAAMNANLAGTDGGPDAHNLENVVVKWLAELAGYPAEQGVLTSGASMANFMAIYLALRKATGPRIRRLGLQGLVPESRFMLYASTEVHFSVERALAVLGLGTDSLCLVPTDEVGRIDVAQLADQVRQHREEGHLPFCVVTTAGTSKTGAIDPITEVANICDQHDLWLHVDGAYGGFCRLTTVGQVLLSGLDRAHSLAVDPHKWLGVPYDAGCLLVKEPAALGQGFGLGPAGGSGDLLHLGLEESRRLRALKIWACIKMLGRDGYRERLEHTIILAQRLQSWIRESPDLELLSAADLSTVIFRFVPADFREEDRIGRTEYLNHLNRVLCDQATSTGLTWAQSTAIRDMVGIRVCLTNFRTTEADVRWFYSLVRGVGAGVHRWLQGQQ